MSNDKLPAKHPYSINNFFCPCCKTLIDTYKSVEKFQRMLIFISNKAKGYFPINSAYRCLTHNKQIGGAERSDHMSMLAVDIGYVNYTDLYLFMKYLLAYDKRIHYRYIKIYANHVHISIQNPQLETKGLEPPVLVIV